MEELKMNFDLNQSNFELESRYLTPKIKTEDYYDDFLNYKYAADLAKSIDIHKRTFVIVNGSFIFGDFIEALLVEQNIQATSMEIDTLSCSQENIDSLAGLMKQNYILNLKIIGSDWYNANEKHRLVPYMMENLDIDNRFQLIIARTHMKTVIFESSKGNKFVIQGSANLRSSGNYEQLITEQNAELYDYIHNFHLELEKKYKMIDHKVKKRKAK